MRSPLAHARPVPLAKRALGACGLVRWLLVLLLMFDQIGAPWHAHHHDIGVDSSFVSAVHADDMDDHASGVETHADTEAHAPDSQHTWAHATTVLRIEAGVSLALADDVDDGPAPSWPGVGLVPAAHSGPVLAIASRHEPPRPVHRSLPPSPQAPPRRA